MTPKTRRTLFLACAFLFMTIAPAMLFHSQGYRFDWHNKKIVKTGGLYFKVIPRGAEVVVDDQIKKRTDMFFASTLISNLLPREYRVEISKPGYQSWQKTLQVEENRVTEAKSIFLIPTSLNLEELSQNVDAFFVSPDQGQIIFKKTAQQASESFWKLSLYDLKTGSETELVDEKNLDREETILTDLVWSSASNRVLFETFAGDEKEYWLLDLRQEIADFKKIILPDQVFSLHFHPIDSHRLIFSQAADSGFNLFGFNFNDPEKKDSATPLIEEALAYRIEDNGILFLSAAGFLQKTGFNGRVQKLNLEPFTLKQEKDYEIFTQNGFLFLRQDQQFFYLDQASSQFREINHGLTSFSVSPSLRKICFFNDYEIWIFFFKEDLSQPQREKGEQVFLTRFSEKINQVFWLNDHYLVFTLNNVLKVIEIDNRDKAQVWELAEMIAPQISFYGKDKKLYVLSEDRFLASGKIE